MGFKNWETPPDFFAKLDEEFHFTLDAAASHENALCGTYCTVDGTFGWKGGVQLSALDGLTYSWGEHRVFCNPPYDSSLYQWVQKAAMREAELSVLLLPPSIDTKWFHEFIWDDGGIGITPKWRRGVTGHFLPKRLRFWRDGKPGESPRAGNLLVVFR